MKLVNKDFETIINKKKYIENWKKALEWWIVKGFILKIGINEVIRRYCYCLKCRKNTENINPRVFKTSNGRTMVLSKSGICDNKKSRFIKN